MRHLRVVVAGAWLCTAALGAQAPASGATSPAVTVPNATAPAAPPPAPPLVLPAPTDSAAIAMGETLEVSLLTMGWGEAIWERFGHNAIRVRDRRTGFDMSYNWGMFDFDQPNFLQRFLTGDTKYWMAGFPTVPLLEVYARQGRAVRAQRLALTAGERGALLAFLEWNALDANRYYRYDYYRDNCSTRARDAIDRVLGGALERALAPIPTTSTWRSSTERLTAHSPFAYVGISLALGRNADRPLTAWQEAFLPVRFARALDSLVIARAGAAPTRLVDSTEQLVPAVRPPEPEQPPTWSMTKSALVAVVVLALCWIAARWRVAGVVLTTSWYLVCGLLGTALLLAGTVTKHIPYMGSNASILLMHPGHLLLALLVPLAVWRWRTRDDGLVRWARRLAIASAAVAIASPLVYTLLGQHVLPIGALAPLHLLGPVALGVGARRDGAP